MAVHNTVHRQFLLVNAWPGNAPPDMLGMQIPLHGVLAACDPRAASALSLLLFQAFTWVYVQARSGFFWQSAAMRLVTREQKQEILCVHFYSQHNAPFLPVSMFAFPLYQQRLQRENLPW